MDAITVPKKEYQRLMEKALRYEFLAGVIRARENIFAPPPTRSVKEVIKSFQATNLYTPSFLKSLEKGLKRSSYFRS